MRQKWTRSTSAPVLVSGVVEKHPSCTPYPHYLSIGLPMEKMARIGKRGRDNNPPQMDRVKDSPLAVSLIFGICQSILTVDLLRLLMK